MKRSRATKIKTIFAIIVIVVLGVVVSGYLIGYIIKPKTGLIEIDTVPQSKVYIDGNLMGTTPFEQEIKQGAVSLRLVASDTSQSLLPYEKTVKIVPKVKTIVRRTFGKGVEDGSGIIISFEENKLGEADLAVISTPNEANILVGKNRYTTPIKLDNISIGTHQIIINKEGYEELSFPIQAESGYILTIEIDLNKTEEIIGFAPEPPKDQKLVTILKTPIGYLRARQEPDIKSKEVGRLQEGRVLGLLDVSEDKKWFKVNLDTGGIGWVSSAYASPSAELTEED